MINLIPNQEKKKKVKDFYFRLTVVSLMVLGLTILVGSVSILPSYFFSVVKKNVDEVKLQTQAGQSITQIDQNTTAIINDLIYKLGIVENAEQTKYLISQKVINEVIAQKMSDIQITEISYDNTTPSGKKIIISGVAPSRDRLLQFSNALSNDAAFQKVDLPISNFVKGSNINFSLNLTPS
jgi:Tfp pilus assembly protein PilN